MFRRLLYSPLLQNVLNRSVPQFEAFNDHFFTHCLVCIPGNSTVTVVSWRTHYVVSWLPRNGWMLTYPSHVLFDCAVSTACECCLPCDDREFACHFDHCGAFDCDHIAGRGTFQSTRSCTWGLSWWRRGVLARRWRGRLDGWWWLICCSQGQVCSKLWSFCVCPGAFQFFLTMIILNLWGRTINTLSQDMWLSNVPCCFILDLYHEFYHCAFFYGLSAHVHNFSVCNLKTPNPRWLISDLRRHWLVEVSLNGLRKDPGL